MGAIVRSASAVNNAKRRSKLKRYASILIAYSVTLAVTSPSLKAGYTIWDECPENLSSTSNNDQHLPITKSKSRGFRPIHVFSKQSAPNHPHGYAQSKQDTLVMALTKANDEVDASIPSNRSPFFVDLAANDAVVLSNSLLLEKHGWAGACLEPNPLYWNKLASYRSCTILGAFAGDKDGREVEVMLSNRVYGGIVGEGMDNTKQSEERRNLVSIATAFREANVPSVVDYFSLDVEGAETLIMQHFPWDEYRFRFITIERPRDDLVGLLTSHGYRKVMTIADFGETLWSHPETIVLSDEAIKLVAGTLGIRDYTGPWVMPPKGAHDRKG